MLRKSLLLVCTALSLAACGDVKQNLGLGRSSPDEFAVVDRPPLAMPPDFGLRPPRPGAPRPQDVDVTARASETLFGSGAQETSGVSTGNEPSDAEKALIAQSGADKVDPDIRAEIERESSEKVGVSDHLVQDLLWWKKDEPTGTVVDSAAEAKRIQDAKDKGEPINQGATPVIEKDKGGWLGL